MEQTNITGLSREFIIHPGETLAEILDDRGMKQSELAIRTDVTEKHISTIIHGQKGISPAFSKKLEYALGIEASFWMNLQSNYDKELLEFEEVNNISESEIAILKRLKDALVLEYWATLGWIDTKISAVMQVLDVRSIFGISNLCNITKIQYYAAYRAQTKNNNVDPYVLFAWQRMCEKMTEDIKLSSEIDLEKLKEMIPEIKRTMFMRANQIQARLTDIFSQCGIAFMIVPNFKGAPVQGFIKRTTGEKIILCMTIRQKYADIFWFTLFHEIAHILNNDTKNNFIDFDSMESSNTEIKADNMARNFLLNSDGYREFTKNADFSRKAIINFAGEQNVCDFIVQGRLMKEKFVPWSKWANRTKYVWA